MIYLIVNTILDYLKRPCTTYLLQIYNEEFCERSLWQDPWTIPKEKLIF